jgi:secreted trypsin-like serine protease
MWQAHSWRATMGWVGDKKPPFDFRGPSTSVVRFLACVLLGIASGSYASERASTLEIGADAIYNKISIQSRVLGGGDAEVGAWPSMAAIVTAGTFALEDRFFCGGTVISDRWILTAAHCMFDAYASDTQPADIRVVVGINDLQDESAIEVVVTNIFVHPQYNVAGGMMNNDIALLELANVVTAPATTLFDGDTETFNDTLAFIAGWGALDQVNGSEVYPNLLQDASVPLVSLARCNSSESYQGGILNTQVCAGFREGGIDSCVGDSGGPLYLIQNGEQVQVGITSFGNECGLPNFYGVYTNISAHKTWINGYVADIELSKNTLASIDETGGAASSSQGGSLNFYFIGLLSGLVYVRRKAFKFPAH